jgi:hypothetical protein
MSQEPRVPPTNDDLTRCAIRATHRRLRDAHTLWHQALEQYHDAERFRANLNAAIEALRNTTFALQKEKAAFSDFDQWYRPWQKKLQDDVTSKWLNGARVTVVHQGDLDSYSFAEVRLITWQEQVLSTVAVPIQTPSRLILQNPALLDLLDPSRKGSWQSEDAALLIERRWSTKELQGREILSALAHVYGLLADLVLDAHCHLGHMNCIPSDAPHRDFPSAYDRTGMLRCMIASVEARTERFKQSTQAQLVPYASVIPTVIDPKEVMERYGIENRLLTGEISKLDPLVLAEKLLFHAKRVLRRDKHHERMMFIRDGEGKWHHHTLVAADRTEKHVVMQLVAQFVESRGCDAVIEIGEMWIANISKDLPPFVRDVESIPGREEALVVVVATRDGLLRRYMTPFARGPFGGIKLGDTEQTEDKNLFYFRPIIEVWIRQRTFRGPDGTLSGVWEPDALDLCPCGGPERYGECCRPRIGKRREVKNAEVKTQPGTPARDINLEEKAARASLAQYVIWIKQHTVAAMHVGKKFHDKIVQIDALALEAEINGMVRALSAVRKTDLILPQLRRLREVVGVPRLAMRVTAITSRWLFQSERYEEAVLELDALGNVSELKDSLALFLIARHTDIPWAERKKVLQKAVEVAACDEERQLARLNLAESLLETTEVTEAMSLVQLVIEETEGDQSSAERSAALILLWKITRAEENFRAAFLEMEKDDQDAFRHRNAIYLIDGGKYQEAEHVLAKLIDAGDIQAKLLLTDARIRFGAGESAGSYLIPSMPRVYLHICSILMLLRYLF